MSRISSCRGLTLTELIITIILVSILVGSLWMVYDSGFRPFYSQNTRIGIKGEAGRSFVNLAREMREAASLTAATQSSVTFTTDTDDNGINETIQYTWSGAAGTALQRISGATTPVINSVYSLAFAYYDSSNSLLSFPVTASQVRVVSLNVTAASQDETFQLRSRTQLRNLSGLA